MNLFKKEEQESYKNVKIRYVCKEKLKNKYLKDHCHYTGEYRGVHACVT